MDVFMRDGIVFDMDELNMIFEDQRNALENMHKGRAMHTALQSCPLDCFPTSDKDEVLMRQEIMKKILNDAAET